MALLRENETANRTVKQLLAAGAAVGKVDKSGQTALQETASTSRCVAMQLLLDAGAAGAADDQTALMLAAGCEEAVRLLFDAGATVHRAHRR